MTQEMYNENNTNSDSENLLEADIPAKFMNAETGEVNVAAMAKSYKALERRLSMMPNPPKGPYEYKIDCSHGMFVPDEEVNMRMYEMGLSNEQAQSVYDMAAEKMVPMIKELHADMLADREVEKLMSHFGGAEQWKIVSRQLLAYGRKNMPKDVLDNLASSYEGVMALYRMMKGQEPSLQRNTTRRSAGTLDETELSSMMRDPKYWRDKDPAYIAKVTEGFKNLYGDA